VSILWCAAGPGVLACSVMSGVRLSTEAFDVSTDNLRPDTPAPHTS
jgi:hypothetical protein